MQHPFRDFVNGSVAAGGDNKITSRFNQPPCLSSSGTRTGGAYELRLDIVPRQRFDGTLKQVLAAR